MYNVVLYGSLGLAATSWFKFFAVVSHQFVLILVIQTFCAISHIFLSAIPSKLAAWFPKNEEWIISGLTIFCNSSGIVLNFISLMVINASTDLRSFMFILAVLSTLLAIISVIIFKEVETPEHPPSYYEALKRDLIIQSDSKTFLEALKILATNKNFVLLSIGFGLQLGIFNGFSTLINSIILYYFPVKNVKCSQLCKVCNINRLCFLIERSNGSRNNLLHNLSHKRVRPVRFCVHFGKIQKL